jgi:oligopeptidase B
MTIVRIVVMATAVSFLPALLPAQAQDTPPVARIIPKVDTLHGIVRTDNYYWLREKTNPEVIAYLEAENAYTNAHMKHTERLQQQLYDEMLGRIKQTDNSVPVRDNGYYYSNRTEQGKNYPTFVRRKGSLSAPEEIYLDQNKEAEGKPYHGLGGLNISPNNQLMIYLEDTTALRVFTLKVKDLSTGAIVDQIETVVTGTAWADDNRTFFYSTADSARRSDKIWRHVIGTPRSADVLVFHEPNVLNNAGVFRSRSGKYIFISADGFTSSEWRMIPTANPTAEPVVLAARRPGIEYSMDHMDGYFLQYTNDGAVNFKVQRAPESNPTTWTDWIPARDTVFVEGIDAFRNYVVVSERAGGLRRIRIMNTKTSATHYVTFPEKAYGVFLGGNPEYDTETLRFTYSSLITPNSTYDYNMRAKTRTLLKKQEIPSGFDASKYEVRRLMAPARDGVKVPVSILMKKGTRLDGNSPLLQYAYGSYGSTTEPTFNANVLSLVDRGFVYAIAHIRGGQEMGRTWYDQGKMMNKMNTFNDFIDVGEELVRQKYSSPAKMVANGGSAGGLLMGVVLNWRPDLYHAVVADVPFVDAINTMLDASLPLTAQEWEQWGNPAIKEQYDYMIKYSPYDNVAAKDYPWILVTTSLNDSQVMYFEPAKWTARLRALKTDHNPLLLKTGMTGGHGGSSGRYDRLKEIAFRYAFMMDAVGMVDQTP